jgi:hypothetical protein
MEIRGREILPADGTEVPTELLAVIAGANATDVGVVCTSPVTPNPSYEHA